MISGGPVSGLALGTSLKAKGVVLSATPSGQGISFGPISGLAVAPTATATAPQTYIIVQA